MITFFALPLPHYLPSGVRLTFPFATFLTLLPLIPACSSLFNALPVFFDFLMIFHTAVSPERQKTCLMLQVGLIKLITDFRHKNALFRCTSCLVLLQRATRRRESRLFVSTFLISFRLSAANRVLNARSNGCC